MKVGLKKTFLKYFPIPVFLKMPAIGLSIFDNSVRLIGFKDSKSGKKIDIFTKVDLPKGVVVDGEIKDLKQLTRLLIDIKRKYKLNFIKASLSDKHSYLFKINIPKVGNMTDEIIRSSLEFKLEENVPLKLDNAVFDYSIVGEDEKKIDLIVSVFSKNIIDSFLKVFNQVGLTAISFESEAQAVARSVIKKEEKGSFMLVDFKKKGTSISVVSNGVVYFTYTVDVGGNELVNSIKRQLNISREEAEKIKIEKGLINTKQNKDIFEAMLGTVSVLKDEINKYYSYWCGYQKDGGKSKECIKKIIFCGEEASLKGLSEYLSSGVNIPIEIANVWVNTNVLDKEVPEINFNNSLGYSTAVGLALESEKL
ncbi:pilus assembly protein PilM [Patescibacteria group bacterium]